MTNWQKFMIDFYSFLRLNLNKKFFFKKNILLLQIPDIIIYYGVKMIIEERYGKEFSYS